jgi:ankyrin repeat protein
MARKKAAAAYKIPSRRADVYGQLLFDMWRDSSVLQRHLDGGQSIEKHNSEGETLLYRACNLDIEDVSRGSDTLVKQLLQAGADPNSRSIAGYTPLMLACSPDVANCLLNNGADIALESDVGSTALELTSAHGNVPVVKVLLKRGAPGQLLQKSRLHTPLSAAIHNKHEEVVVLLLHHLLLQPDFDINFSQLGANQPLLCCAAMLGLRTVAEFALDHGADPNARGRDGPPLMLAVQQRHVSMVSLLCERGANMQARFGYRNSLDVAVIGGVAKVVSTLIKHGADVNVVYDATSLSAVLQAMALGSSDNVQLLLNAGAVLDAERLCDVLCAMCDDDFDDAKICGY